MSKQDDWAKKKGFETYNAYQNDWAKKKGYSSFTDYQNSLAKRLGFDSFNEYNKSFIIKRGFRDEIDYRNSKSQERGFETFSKEKQAKKYKSGKAKPMSENKSCSSYLGVHIVERMITHIFEKAIRMPYGNKGFDLTCPKGYKIDSKSACLRILHDENKNTGWSFLIGKNKIADYFILIAFDKREDLNPLHVWLIKGTDIVGVQKKIKLNEKQALHIFNTTKSVEAYKKYELTDKLDKVITCCNTLKAESDK